MQYCRQVDKFHVDEILDVSFPEQILHDLENYGYGFLEVKDDSWIAESEVGNDGVPNVLWKPFSEHEPVMSSEELAELDCVGDDFEISRLVQMGVLKPVQSDDPVLTIKPAGSLCFILNIAGHGANGSKPSPASKYSMKASRH